MNAVPNNHFVRIANQPNRMEQMCYPLLTEEADPENVFYDLDLSHKLENLGDISMYINIPFCDWICHFCPYTKYKTPKKVERISSYVSCLKKELNMYAATEYIKNSQIGAIYFGGGTPTILSAEDLGDLLDYCHKLFNLSKAAEITIEGSPVNFSYEKLLHIKKCGANRISLGLQSFDNKTLKMLGIPSKSETIFDCIENARKAGIKNINADLIYALPGQTLNSWKKDIQIALNAKPYSLSLLPLALVPKTPLFVKVKRGKFPQPPGLEEEYGMYQYAVETLTKNGYLQNCAVDFALEGQESKHIELYYSAVDAIAIGAGAYGYINRCMYVNTLSINNYINLVNQGNFPVAYIGRANTLQKRMERKMILNLKLMKVEKQEFKQLFDKEVEECFPEIIADMKEKGVLENDENQVRLTPAGIFWTNNLCRQFYSKEYQDYMPRQFFKSKSEQSAYA
jgi:oxygen-independent coproporphyrinogen-3 oxidase